MLGYHNHERGERFKGQVGGGTHGVETEGDLRTEYCEFFLFRAWDRPFLWRGSVRGLRNGRCSPYHGGRANEIVTEIAPLFIGLDRMRRTTFIYLLFVNKDIFWYIKALMVIMCDVWIRP